MGMEQTRRGFLRNAGAAGLVLGFASGRVLSARAAEAVQAPFDAYLRITPDGTVTVLCGQFEMGQGSWTGLATMVAEELDADWNTVRAEGASGNDKLYGNPLLGGMQGTGGSTSMPAMWDRYRIAGAAARAMLVAAAAKAWGVPARKITIARGVLHHASGRQGGFGEFAVAAAMEDAPASPKPKDRKDWTLIGAPHLRRVDTVAKSTGQKIYTIDVHLPGMLTAVITHPPLFGAKVKSFDASKARAVPGVVDVVQVERGVAVVAKDTWSAIKGKRVLAIEWDESGADTRGSDELMAAYRAAAKNGRPAVARNDGDAERVLAASPKVIEAAYEFPYLAHAALEPLNAVARLENGVLEIWSGHQMPSLYQAVGAQMFGLPMDRVKLHVLMSGGSFGRRAVPDADYIVDTLSVLKATGAKAPIKMQWLREDDMTAGRYRPMYYHVMRASLDGAGNIAAWHQRIVGQSIMHNTPFEKAMVHDGVDGTSVEGGATLPYAIPNLKVDLVTMQAPPTVLWWRSVGSTHNAYSTEVFVDELAHEAKRDPVAFRRAMLKGQARFLSVLDLLAEKAQWSEQPPAGIFRGVALHKSFNTVVGQVVEVSLKDGGGIKVERVVCAVHCGTAVNPDVIRAQMEGGIGFGLGAVLKSQITLDKGRVQQTNFDTYQVLAMDEMPKVEVHIVPSEDAPTGVGEPGVPPIGPALANAVFAATGKRVRVLPFSKSESGRA